MEITNLIIKEIQKAKAETIVRQEISTVNFDITVHKKVLSFLINTIFLGAFWVWCSSSDTSNYAVFIQKNEWTKYFFVLLPIILEILFFVPIIISVKNIKKQTSFEYWMSNIKWKKLYQRFILQKIEFPMDENKILSNLNKANAMLKKHEDIIFYKDEFADYLREFYKNYRVCLSYDFYNYLADVILISCEIDGTLVSEPDGRYTFIIEKNNEFLSIVTLNVAK